MIVVAGARPNFMKIGPLLAEVKNSRRWQALLVHTGQHYDYKMSDVFFKELGIPAPDVTLNVAPGSHAGQTAGIMTAFEEVVIKEKPDLVVVVGDVNSTLACSLVASKLNIKVAHVEAGLRSFDRGMPEEVNRLVTDAISEYLFVSEPSGLVNLRREGTSPKKIIYAGNIMIDTLHKSSKLIQASKILSQLKLKAKTYCVVTLHRPSNVDSRKALLEIYEILKSTDSLLKIVYPVHPRTRKMMEKHGCAELFEALPNLIMTEPLGYVDFVRLVKDSRFALTDSGGIQEETTVLKVPCITMRENTERPATVKEGTNVLVGRDHKKILALVKQIMSGKWKKSRIPKFWDGNTARRIVAYLEK